MTYKLNSRLSLLFIYLFFEIVASRWFNEWAGAVTNGLMGIIHVPHGLMMIITSLAIFAFEWNLCKFLYKKGIFFKI